MKLNVTTTIFSIVLLFVGALIGNFVVTYMPANVGNAWISGFVIALIQAIILSVAGFLTGKMNIMTLVIAGLLIFVGGLLGGYLGGMIGLTGLYLTVVILLIQTLLLSFTGYLKGAKGGSSKLKL